LGRHVDALHEHGQLVCQRSKVSDGCALADEFADGAFALTAYLEVAPDILNLHNWSRSSTRGGADDPALQVLRR
jgi:hypothetical protein